MNSSNPYTQATKSTLSRVAPWQKTAIYPNYAGSAISWDAFTVILGCAVMSSALNAARSEMSWHCSGSARQGLCQMCVMLFQKKLFSSEHTWLLLLRAAIRAAWNASADSQIPMFDSQIVFRLIYTHWKIRRNTLMGSRGDLFWGKAQR